MNDYESNALDPELNPYGRQSLSGLKSGINKFIIPLKRFWWMLLPFVSISVLYQVYKIDQIEESYISEGTMRLTGRLKLPESGLYDDAYVHFFGTAEALMASKEIQNRARKRLEITDPEIFAENPRILKFIARHRENTAIFQLRAESSHQQYAQKFLNACMEEYILSRKEAQVSITERTMASINADAHRTEIAIQEIHNQIRAFLTKNNMTSINDQVKHTTQTLFKLNDELNRLKRDKALLISFLEQAKVNENTSNIDSFLYSLEILKVGDASGTDRGLSFHSLSIFNNKFNKIYEQYRAKYEEVTKFQGVLRPEHPKMIGLQKQLDYLNRELGHMRDQIKIQIENQSKGLEIRIANLEELIREWEGKSESHNSILADYNMLQKKLQLEEDKLERARDNVGAIQASEALSEHQELIQIDQRASTASPYRPRLVNELPKAIFMGLSVGFGFIFIFSRWRETVHSESDLPMEAQVKLISQIPRLRTSQQGLLQPDDTRHAFVESFRNLRSFVLIDGNRNVTTDGAQILCITSAIPSEGKSTISSNLSVSLAQAGYKTLLIDADMRQGNQHKNFNTADNPGLSQILNNEVHWQSCVWPTESPNLEIIPRGPAVLNSSELILRPACHTLFEEIKPVYQFVIIDTPPVLATDDVSNLLSDVDQLFVVCRLSLSNARAMNQTIEMLHDRQANISGFVLNACGPSSAGYYKYRYYEQYGAARSK